MQLHGRAEEVTEHKTLEWRFTDQGTWVAEGYMWGYELIRNPTATDIKGQPTELWNVRVWRIHADADRPESRIIGGYNSVETAQWYMDRAENNPRAPFKVHWFDRIFNRDDD